MAKSGTSRTVEDQIEVGAHGECEPERDSHEQGADEVYRSTDGVLGPKLERTPDFMGRVSEDFWQEGIRGNLRMRYPGRIPTIAAEDIAE